MTDKIITEANAKRQRDIKTILDAHPINQVALDRIYDELARAICQARQSRQPVDVIRILPLSPHPDGDTGQVRVATIDAQPDGRLTHSSYDDKSYYAVVSAHEGNCSHLDRLQDDLATAINQAWRDKRDVILTSRILAQPSGRLFNIGRDGDTDLPIIEAADTSPR
jgi:hypothetical protein